MQAANLGYAVATAVASYGTFAGCHSVITIVNVLGSDSKPGSGGTPD